MQVMRGDYLEDNVFMVYIRTHLVLLHQLQLYHDPLEGVFGKVCKKEHTLVGVYHGLYISKGTVIFAHTVG